jgi:membrane protease YdiL (CAAX protease family)
MEEAIVHLRKNAGSVSSSKQDQFSTLVNCILFWLVFMGLLFLGGSFFVPLFRKDWSSMFFGIAGTIAAMTTIFFFLKKEKLSFRQIWLAFEWRSLTRFLSGYLMGTIICAFMIAVLILSSDLQLRQNKSFVLSTTIFISYLAFIPLGLMEELAFRSYTFVKLNATFNFQITQLTVAIAFAAYHIIGGQGILSSLLGPGVWAYVFGLATIRYRGIAMPLGLHVAANVSQALAGMKGKKDAIWLLDYSVPPGVEAMARTETIGVLMHIMMLIIALLLTELYSRKTKKFNHYKY